MIKALLKKDLYNLSSYKVSLMIVIIFCVVAVAGTKSFSIAPIIICAIIGMISLSSFNYDEVSKSDKYILTLPASRKEIVGEKYILAIASTVFGGVIGVILTAAVAFAIKVVKSDAVPLDVRGVLTATIGGMLAISLIQAIQIPSIYKWGAERGRVQMFILLFVIVAAASAFGYFITKTDLDIDEQALENFMSSFGVLLMVIFMAVIYSVSYMVSYKIYKNKEL